MRDSQFSIFHLLNYNFNSYKQYGDDKEQYTYLITLIPRNITSQLQCISASAAGTSAIPVTDE